MPSAECENCGHQWELTKPLSEYADGGPHCPDCGSTDVSTPTQPVENQQKQDTQTPARQTHAQAGSLVETGMQGGDALTKLTSDDPVESAEGLESALHLLAGGLVQVGKKHAQTARDQSQAAKQTRSEDLTKANQYPDCPECGKALRQVPPEPGAEFSCPHCGEILERA